MEVPFLVILTLVNNPVYVKVILVDVEALDNVGVFQVKALLNVVYNCLQLVL